MKKLNLLSLLVLLAALVSSCSKDDDAAQSGSQLEVVNLQNGATLEGSYSGKDIRLAEGTYTLKAYVYLTGGSKLTIAPGTTIKSDITQKGALIVERGSQLIADGTAAKPIIFTSGKPVGQRLPGDWGGIILLGKAPTNRSTEPLIEGGVNRNYGGTDPNDNSGILRYVRIEFAGIAAEPGSEINGLTLGAVGSGTTLDYIQITYGNDDAYEFFGGNVNAKHLIAYGTADDDFDFDFGYTGKIQFAVSLRNPEFVDAGDAGNGIECDNDGAGSSATPITRPVISNMTILGPNGAANTAANHNFANRFRRGTRFVLNNSILLGHPDGGLSLESNSTYDAFIAGNSEFKNNLIYALAASFKLGGDVTTAGATAAAIQTKATTDGTVLLANSAGAGLTDPFNLLTPNFLPATGSVALTGAAFSGATNDTFFERVTYKGAFGGTSNWASGWTNFNFTKTATGY